LIKQDKTSSEIKILNIAVIQGDFWRLTVLNYSSFISRFPCRATQLTFTTMAHHTDQCGNKWTHDVAVWKRMQIRWLLARKTTCHSVSMTF